MIDLMDITDAELERYVNKLIPRLMKKKPAEWTPISRIAHDPKRFLDVVECLASYCYFDNTEGYCMIDLNSDEMCIRIDPQAIRFPYTKCYQWKFYKP